MTQKNGNMNIAPDRKTDIHTIIRNNYISEPKDWFTHDKEEPEGIEYTIEDVIVLTIKDSDRYENFLKLNAEHKVNFIPFYGASGESTENLIFDNYLNILNSWFNENKKDVVYIAEDDVLFLPNAFPYLIDIMRQLPIGWDTLSGNFSALPKIKQISKNLIRPIGSVSSMNFTVFHRRSLDKINSMLHLRDRGKKSKFNHIDRYCFSEELNLNAYGAWPMLCREIPGYSYNSRMVRSTFQPLMESQPYRFWFLDRYRWTP